MMRAGSAGGLSRLVDKELGRLAFLGLVAGIAGSLAVGLTEIAREALASRTVVVEAAPEVPAVDRVAAKPARTAETASTRFATAYDAFLSGSMTFTPAGSVLLAEGSIEAGSAARLAEAIKANPALAKVSLNSPGGALDDAVEMAKLIRESGLATEIADGAICASSCPLAFAGGLVRTAGPKAAVAVHQFYSASAMITEPAQALADAQMTAARISRHLDEMGVDPAAWLHALDTLPEKLYYFTSGELASYRLVTAPVRAAGR
jgi:hypothetical protein